MTRAFWGQHWKELLAFGVGVVLAVVFFTVPELHRDLGWIERLGYPGMFLAGILYGSGLTSSLAMIIFLETPPGLNLFVVAVLGGLGSALYDLTIFYITRRESKHGWLASVIERARLRRGIPNWVTVVIGSLILISPLPDELAAGLFGIGKGRAKIFFLYSFVSNAVGVALLSAIK